jgi:hypothetical protein
MQLSEMVFVKGVPAEKPVDKGLGTKKVGGMVVPEVNGGLTELTVVATTVVQLPGRHDTFNLTPGDKIQVPSIALARFEWAKEVFTIDDVSFIVVPAEFILAY